ncbi:MAG TPA: ankyrin repeat domain-containing protein [Gemmatimonadales bacterium]|nr:ankyrin repeat domain-containing protein [Gemmatimonadales bacterium]
MSSLRSLVVVTLVVPLLSLGHPATGAAQALRPDAQSRLWDAAIAGDTAAITSALNDGARVDSLDLRQSRNGRRALNWAALNNHVPAIRLLLARGAGIQLTNLTGFTPLHHAAEVGASEAAMALLAAGADPTWPNDAGQSPAEVAAAHGHGDLADALAAAASRVKPAPKQP